MDQVHRFEKKLAENLRENRKQLTLLVEQNFKESCDKIYQGREIQELKSKLFSLEANKGLARNDAENEDIQRQIDFVVDRIAGQFRIIESDNGGLFTDLKLNLAALSDGKMCPQDQSWIQKKSTETQTDNLEADLKIRPAVAQQPKEPLAKQPQVQLLGKRPRGRPRKYPLIPQSQVPE